MSDSVSETPGQMVATNTTAAMTGMSGLRRASKRMVLPEPEGAAAALP